MKQGEKDRQLFDSIAAIYARKDVEPVSRIPRLAMLMEALRPLLDDKNGLGRILDIGCGIGAPAKFLRGSYSHYLGVDHSENLIAAARDFNSGNRQAEFLSMDIKDISRHWNGADLILSMGALHHMTDLDAVMDTLAALANPGCVLVVVEPQRSNPLIQFMRWVRGRVDASYSREQIFFSARELGELCARHGVREPSIQYIGFFSTPFAEVVLKPEWLFLPVSRLATAIDIWLGRHLPRWLAWMSFKVVVRGRFS